MVGLPQRMRRLRTLLNIRLGPGAATLSPTVSRIHLTFARKMNQGHLGPRKFWHTYLPRLKFHNPAVPMTVDLTTDQEGPASLTVSFTSPADSPNNTASANPSAATMSTSGDKASSNYTEVENTKSIDMKHKHESKILEELMALVNGKSVVATAEEEQELSNLEDQRAKSEQDRVRTAGVVAAKRRQAQILANARQSLNGSLTPST